MALVPKHFQRGEDDRERCGDSWRQNSTVTGEIPGTDHFGSDRFKVLLGFVEPWELEKSGSFGMGYGWRSDAEKEFRQTLLSRIDAIDDAAEMNSTWLTGKQIQAVNWLTDHAEAELEGADRIYDKWVYREGQSYPLTREDTPSAFNSACSSPPRGDADPQYVRAGPRGDTLKCPTRELYKDRERDRQMIGFRFHDAAAHIRCAEWGLWRMILYAQSREEYEPPKPEIGMKATPGGSKPTPGGLKDEMVWKLVEPIDWPVPDPDGLGDPEDLPPDDAPPPAEPPSPPPPTPEAAPKKTSPLLVGGIAAAGLLLLPRLFK